MDLPGDDRAAVIQVGAVLIFGILVITLAIYQSQVVPNQNREVEFDHHQTVEQRMVDLRNALLTSAVANAGRPAAVPLGTQYPTRLLAINPPQPAGRLATEPLGNISLANARATNAETDDYITGTGRPLNFSTSALVYTPDYNELGSPPSFVYENTLLYSNDTGGQGFIQGLTGQELLEGSTITLVALQGNLSQAGARSVTVDPQVLSGGYRTVQIRNESAGPVNITIPTRVGFEEWRARLNRSVAGDRLRNVTSVRGGNAVRISLRNGTYTLRMAKLGVGTGAVDPEPRYIVPVGSTRTSIAEGTTTELTFEVRDEYNNPVTDASVTVTTGTGFLGSLQAPDGSTVSAGDTLQTDEDGRLRLAYDAPDDVDGVQNFTVSANLPGSTGGPDNPRSVEVAVSVQDTDGSGSNAGGGGGGNVNPVDGDTIVYQGVVESVDDIEEGPSLTIQLQNLNQNTTRTIERAKFSFYNAAPTNSNNNRSVPATVEFGDGGVTLTRNGAYRQVGESFTPNQTKDLLLTFFDENGDPYQGQGQGNNAGGIRGGDFFVISVIYGDGTTGNYFISPSSGTSGSTATSGISSASVTDIVPNVGAQRQLLRVTLGTDLAGTETIDFDLGAAQGTNQVNYGSASAQAVSGGSASFNQQGTTDAVVQFDPPGDLSAGDTIEVLVTGISVGSQDSSYTVSVSRSDEGGTATTTTFEVARGSGTSNLQSASASDLQSGQTGQTQTISFRPDEQLAANERVFIDLSDAEGGTVDYTGSATVTAGPGTIENKNRNGGTATVVYKAPSGGVPSGTEVEVSVSGVSTSGTGSYTIGFSRERGDTEGASFSVISSAGSGESVSLDSATIVGGNIDLSFDNTGSSDATVAKVRLIDYTDNQAPNEGNTRRIDRVIYDPGGATTTLDEGDPLEGVGGPTITAGSTATITLAPQYEKTNNNKYKSGTAEAGDQVTIEIEFADGTTGTYDITL